MSRVLDMVFVMIYPETNNQPIVEEFVKDKDPEAEVLIDDEDYLCFVINGSNNSIVVRNNHFLIYDDLEDVFLTAELVNNDYHKCNRTGEIKWS